MERAEFTARFGRGVVTRADFTPPRELAARVLHVVHARKLVLLAHQPALKTWKVPRWLPSTAALVGTPGLMRDVNHVIARYVLLAVQRAHLVGLVE